MSVRRDIKTLVVQSNWTFVEVAREMTKITGKNYTCPNLSQKLSRGTLKYEEASLIAEILGYGIKFIKK